MKEKNIWKKLGLDQLIIPLTALALLLLFNLIRDPSFYAIGITYNNSGNPVLSGNIISIIDSASELAIIAIGMTMVTAATGGQDISVGAVGAISATVFVTVLRAFSDITIPTVLLGIALWGVGMGAQESILKAAVASMVPKTSRATGYGIFECAFGAAWFLGSWLLGLLYETSLPVMIAVSVLAQLAAIPLYLLSGRERATENG